MLPALPDPPPVRALPAVALVCLLAMLAGAGVARALVVEVGEPHARSDHLWVDASLTDLFGGAVAKSLERGMPATLQVRAELWRDRAAWFDRLEATREASVRIRYEVWNEAFRIERPGAPARILGSLDSVRIVLERPMGLSLTPLDRLDPDARYFIVVTATLAPLSVEDVQEVEGWLSGEVESKRHSGFGVFTELPHALFDTVRNFTGFGDRHARAQTRTFSVPDLEKGP